jgi:hypothetical protein
MPLTLLIAVGCADEHDPKRIVGPRPPHGVRDQAKAIRVAAHCK